jgi:hypothetical protein
VRIRKPLLQLIPQFSISYHQHPQAQRRNRF